MPMIVPIADIPDYPASRREVNRMRGVLERQGQIEPVVLNSAMEVGYNWYDAAIVAAARELKWDTILVTWPGELRQSKIDHEVDFHYHRMGQD
jgi:hypothetical protein